MINEFYKDMTGKGSIIRQFFDYANKKGAEIGMENIYNFSIGNPSVPVPQAFTDRMICYVQEYRGNPGDEENHRFLHNMRYPELEKKKLILVSTCGYEVTDNCYDAVFAEFDRICGEGKYTTVLAPQGGPLSEQGFAEKVARYLEKFKEAGHEYAREGCLSERTWNKLQRPLLGHSTFEMAINMNWDNPEVGPYGKLV